MPGLGDELITVAEITTILKLNQQTIRNSIDLGKLPHVRLGERWVRVSRSDFDVLIGESPTSHMERVIARSSPSASIWDGMVPWPVVPVER